MNVEIYTDGSATTADKPGGWPWESAMDMCDRMCFSYAQDYSDVKLYGMGGCICDNEEGRKMDKGYVELLKKERK